MNPTTKILVTFFAIGRLLSLTPFYHHSVTRYQKIYSCVLVTLIAVITSLSENHRNLFSEYLVKQILYILSDINLLVFSCYTPLSTIFWNRENWIKLIQNLKFMVSTSSSSSKISKYVQLAVVRLLVKLVALILIYDFWATLFGWTYITSYNIHYLQYYLFYSYHIFVDVILYIIFLQYRHLNALLKISVDSDHTLQKIKQNYCFLKDTVDVFNEIFGWSTAFAISYTILYVLLTFDFMVMNTMRPKNGYLEIMILADVVLVIFTIVGTSVVILRCDLILKEADNLVKKAYKLQRNCNLMIYQKQFERFSNALDQNFPKFSAARFFNIERCTILNIVNTIITIFIVMIQFRNVV
ncbi:hypothetical protein Zmor_019061 [Zophobas morio]|uniref:Gustatory receptor n=1 Tax=Zophobas morio TaxID=2755281 RepID=A0AA38ME83_9CUCU|nr:hypothetical protein Zmor_019061 [Zophobas morio]